MAESSPPSKKQCVTKSVIANEKRLLVETDSFKKWMLEILISRGFSSEEASDTATWAAATASYEVETHGPRKLLSLLDHEFTRSGNCVPHAKHEVLLTLGSVEVWDGNMKLGPAVAALAQARSAEMATSQGMGVVFVRNCNHFGWGPAYALEQVTKNDELLVGNATQGAIPIVTPIGGSNATIGSNAIAVALSTGLEECPTFLWDTGTAAMSWGEVQKCRLEGGDLRPGTCLDANGKPTLQAAHATSLLPAGTIGNALGAIIEVISASIGAGDPRVRSAPRDTLPDGEPSTCVFIFFALNLAIFDRLAFPRGCSRKENVARMVNAIYEDNRDARIVGLRKLRAKKRSEHHGGLLFARESIDAFKQEAETRGVQFPEVREIEVAVEQVVVAPK
mmetsp:Transcript_52644/g.87456  ORF Transcript_52644/g.87456 Transcript_52644/m.87456 type:complete len:392 (-) Transcript_52644:108-1283(-)|eukprot:CAMPEP_0119301420 /NCGR_PEP_ID=MMETSP1333-20130426/3206_1 /TAXON_ID=418940 /ORGANISM="Scyphosphaera apsteinii, Strain RCC1455" /LENGTH=391 /DNA_ID=CAMNT_0007303491 /DNA_START=58 /DNA_END=1233 /DNA_ORIENTATION=+